jgi:hypothetical protein
VRTGRVATSKRPTTDLDHLTSSAWPAEFPAAVLPRRHTIQREWLTVHDNVTRQHRCSDNGELVDDAVNDLDRYGGHCARTVAALRRTAGRLSKV